MSTTLRKGSTCPICTKGKLVPIVYGLPGSELQRDSENGLVSLGGCVVTGNDPELECLGCEARFKRDGELVVANER
jgi:hypothetical protein